MTTARYTPSGLLKDPMVWVSSASLLSAVGIGYAVWGWLQDETIKDQRKLRRKIRRQVNHSFGDKKEKIILGISHLDWNRLSKSDLERVYFHFAQRQQHRDSNEGRLGRQEFAQIYQEMGVEDAVVIESLFRSWDTNVDGFVDFLELVQTINLMLFGTMRDKLRLYFNAYDLDRSGFIRPHELHLAFCAFYAASSEAEVAKAVAEFFEIADTNHDHQVSFQEFLHMGVDPRYSFELSSCAQFHGNFLKKFGIDASAME